MVASPAPRQSQDASTSTFAWQDRRVPAAAVHSAWAPPLPELTGAGGLGDARIRGYFVIDLVSDTTFSEAVSPGRSSPAQSVVFGSSVISNRFFNCTPSSVITLSRSARPTLSFTPAVRVSIPPERWIRSVSLFSTLPATLP